MMPTGSELNDEVNFDAVLSNYENQSPLRILKDIIEECWRKACLHSNSRVLLVKKACSERERATSNCTGDHRYGKKALSPKCLRAVKGAIASVQLPQPRQKTCTTQTGGRHAKMPLTQAVITSHVSKGHSLSILVSCEQREQLYYYT